MHTRNGDGLGMAFTARPDTVVPAYRVATGLLVVLDADADRMGAGSTGLA